MMDGRETMINSYCHHCAEPIKIQLKNGKVLSSEPKNPLVYISIPAGKWWNNIVDTCSNNMVFHSNKEHLEEWRLNNLGVGEAITVSKTLELDLPLFKGRLNLELERPLPYKLAAHFDKIGLRGDFWKLK